MKRRAPRIGYPGDMSRWTWGTGQPPEPTPDECERAAVADALERNWSVRQTYFLAFWRWLLLTGRVRP
jgi:hypothetical protein